MQFASNKSRTPSGYLVHIPTRPALPHTNMAVHVPDIICAGEGATDFDLHTGVCGHVAEQHAVEPGHGRGHGAVVYDSCGIERIENAALYSCK